MPVSVEIIEDSVGPLGQRITSMAITYPRRIHAEFMTHRVFSRNASSSRAIPVSRLLRDTVSMPAVPEHWGANQRGMQARNELSGLRRWIVERLWHGAKWAAASCAWAMDKAGAHKQLVNRLIEPFGHITVLVTATSWANFWALRDHPDADPTIWVLARAMRDAYDASVPRVLGLNEWHLPFVSQQERRELPLAVQTKLSVARCARVSYLTHDRKAPGISADCALYERLAYHSPMHASPLEHQAMPDTRIKYYRSPVARDGTVDHGNAVLVEDWASPGLHGNLTGFIQYRKTLPHETASEFEPWKAAA